LFVAAVQVMSRERNMAVTPMRAASFGLMTLLSIAELVLFSASRSSPPSLLRSTLNRHLARSGRTWQASTPID
jgi:hypothetical protein